MPVAGSFVSYTVRLPVPSAFIRFNVVSPWKGRANSTCRPSGENDSV